MSRPEEMTIQEGIEAIPPRNVAGRAVLEGKGKMPYWSLTWRSPVSITVVRKPFPTSTERSGTT
jgi:hypothetical protein